MMLKYVSILAILLVGHVHSIMWYLEPNTQKCLKEEVQAQVSVAGEYLISEALDQKVDCSVRDSNGHILYQKEDAGQGKLIKFSFSTETPEVFTICFKSHVPQHVRGIKQEIMLVIKRGIEAKSYEALGEAAKLKPVEVELKHLEDLSTTIVQDFARMRKNEEEMRDTNEATNSRVLYLSIFSICCLLGLSTWQVFYLRRFFRAKKLIE